MPAAWPAHIALIFVQLFFGSLPVLGKYVLQAITPMTLVCLRIAGAAVLMWGMRLALRLSPVRGWRDHGLVVIFALFGVSLNQILFMEGLARTTAINASVLTTAIPVNTTLLAILLRQERATPLKALGILLSLTGALSLVGLEGLDFSDRYLVGNLLIFANTISYSIYLVISKPMLERYAPLSVVTLVFGYGLALMVPFGIPAVQPAAMAGMEPGTWAGLAAIIVFPTVGAYVLNSWALKRTGASLVAVYIYLQPLVTTVLGVTLLGERIGSRTVFSAALLFSGVWLVSQARRREREDAGQSG